MREKEEREAAHAATLEAAKAPEGETLAEKLAREKEERKQAALARSQQRQAEKAYFEQRKRANEIGLAQKEATAAAKRAALAAIGVDATTGEAPVSTSGETAPSDVLLLPPLPSAESDGTVGAAP